MIRRLLLAGVALLYVFSIPWYREPGAESAIVGGLPDWVMVALGCYVAAAVLNSLAWLATDVPDPDRPVASDAPHARRWDDAPPRGEQGADPPARGRP